MSADLSGLLVVKAGNVWALSQADGSFASDAGSPAGIWMEDCRYVSRHEVRLNGRIPGAASGSDERGHSSDHELVDPEGAVLATLVRSVAAEGQVRETLTLEPRRPQGLEVDLELRLEADFAPMFGVRGILPAPRAPVEVDAGAGELRLSRVGRDGVRRSTEVTARPQPDEVSGAGMRFRLSLRPGVPVEVHLVYRLRAGGAAAPAEHGRMRPAAEPAPSTSSPRFDDLLRRALRDARMLRSTLDGHEYHAAGIPWYATLFGRDSLIAALQLLPFAPGASAGTLRALASRLGRREDPAREEEPGKVLHELRVGEAAVEGATPLARYYGSVDATPLFLCLIAEHVRWTGEIALVEELRGAVEAAAGWLDRRGLLTYRPHDRSGLRNQGWKDSDDGIPGGDGRPLDPPIALVEAQGYAVAARRSLAEVLELAGDAEGAARQRAEGAALQERLRGFWLDDRGFYAMALDGRGQPSPALGSNQGHLLWAGAVPGEHLDRVRDVLMGPQMFSGWGIRTLAEGEAGYDPLGYHLGTVWPHDTALIAVGLRRHGFDEDFLRLFDALLEAAELAPGRRLPELLSGRPRLAGMPPEPYPAACRPQAWAAGALPQLLIASLGLQPDAAQGRLHIVRPLLPAGVDRLELRGLRVGHTEVDLAFERASPGGSAAATATAVRGDLEVEIADG